MKELLKLDSICQSYAQMKNGSSFFDSQCSKIMIVQDRAWVEEEEENAIE